MEVDDSVIYDGIISVNFSGTGTEAIIPGNMADLVTPSVSGAHVSIIQGRRQRND